MSTMVSLILRIHPDYILSKLKPITMFMSSKLTTQHDKKCLYNLIHTLAYTNKALKYQMNIPTIHIKPNDKSFIYSIQLSPTSSTQKFDNYIVILYKLLKLCIGCATSLRIQDRYYFSSSNNH